VIPLLAKYNWISCLGLEGDPEEKSELVERDWEKTRRERSAAETMFERDGDSGDWRGGGSVIMGGSRGRETILFRSMISRGISVTLDLSLHI
jgi:hypothetical protein